MFKKLFSILAISLIAVSYVGSTVFAEGFHISTRLAASTSIILQTIISQPLPIETRNRIIKIIEKLKPNGFDTSRVESREIQHDLSDVIQKIESDKPGIYMNVLANIKELIKEMINEEAKEHALVNYPHIISELREIKLDLDMPDGKSATIRPDGHFIGPDGEEFFVCFNSNLSKLKNIIFQALERYYNDHSVRLWTYKNALFNTAKGKDPGRKLPFGEIFSMCFKCIIFSPTTYYNIVSSDTKEIVSQPKFLANECAWLNKWMSECGTKIENSSTPCVIKFSKDPSHHGITRIEDPFYGVLEQELYSASVNESNLKNRVRTFNDLLDFCLKRYTPDASIENAIGFPFPLTRIDHYLRQIENDGLDDKDPDTVFAIRTLREKINLLSLRYKFASLNEQAPLLNVRIGRCKIILETDNKKMIFIDRTQTKAFIKEIEKKLDAQASNITGNHDFQPMTGAQLRDLVRALNPESYQNMLDNLHSEIIDMKAQTKSLKAQAIATCAKVSLKILDLKGNVQMLIPGNNDSKYTNFTKDEIKEYIETDKHIQSSAENKFIELDVIEHMRNSNPTADAKCIAVSELSPAKPQEPKVDRGFEEKILIPQREVAENMTRLGQELRRANFKQKDIDDLLKGFH